MGALQAESETRHRAATRLNNDAVAKASQGPQNRKSLKRLPHRTRTADFTNTPDHACAIPPMQVAVGKGSRPCRK
jgi:hypothetical protein